MGKTFRNTPERPFRRPHHIGAKAAPGLDEGVDEALEEGAIRAEDAAPARLRRTNHDQHSVNYENQPSDREDVSFSSLREARHTPEHAKAVARKKRRQGPPTPTDS